MTIPCPECQTATEVPRAAMFVPGDHETTCPNGHRFQVSAKFEAKPVATAEAEVRA